MSDDLDMKVGSLDSGMGDTLAATLGKFLLDDDTENDRDKREEEEEEDEEEDIEETEKTVKSSRSPGMAMLPRHLTNTRGMSESSEETLPSGTEDREISTRPRTREERIELLKELLETYFSDNYLTRDLFLLKHFRKSKDRWISLKFMASYKKIKRIAKGRAEVEEAVRMSPLLEVNNEGNKVRRLAPFPACIDEYIPTRMTLIADLPEQMQNLGALSNFLGHYGEVAAIQILRPGVNLPEALWETVNNFPELRNQWCAVAEFDEIQAAGQLASDINEGKTDSNIAWAMEIVMPWKTGKNIDHQEKPLWVETIKNRCRSCPSSGYSSPSLTPEQSPHGSGIGKHNNIRGLSKRERIMMSRTHNTSSSQYSHFPTTTSHSCSPISQKTYYRTPRQQQGGVGGRYCPPKHSSSQLTAETCDNWRAAPAAR